MHPGGDNIIAWVAAIGGLLSGVTSAGLLIVALVQLPFFRKQLQSMEAARRDLAKAEKERRTLDACNRFHTDTTLYEVKQHIYVAREDANPIAALLRPEVRRDVINLLNYFEGLAIGVEQGVYDDEIVYDNLSNALVWAVEYFIMANAKYNPEQKLGDPDEFVPLLRLYQRYTQKKIGLAAPITYRPIGEQVRGPQPK